MVMQSRPSKGSVLLAGGDAGRRDTFLQALRESDYSPVAAQTVAEIREHIKGKQPVAFLLFYDGVDDTASLVFAELGDAVASTVTLLISSSRENNARARTLNLKADEFLIEPLSAESLATSLDQALSDAPAAKRRGVLTSGDMTLDREHLRVTLRGELVGLHPGDVRVLEFLMMRGGRAATRKEIADEVWGRESAVDERTVDVIIGRIRDAMRNKVAIEPIRTIRSVGYAFDEAFGKASSLPKKRAIARQLEAKRQPTPLRIAPRRSSDA